MVAMDLTGTCDRLMASIAILQEKATSRFSVTAGPFLCWKEKCTGFLEKKRCRKTHSR
jgi:hypothetical protein